MTMFIPLTPEQRALEEAADVLIRSAPRDPDHPAYTERQLARRGPHVISVDALAEVAVAPSQSLRDELRFLMSVSRLRPALRACLRLWIDGSSQQEIAAALDLSQQRVSQRLRRALRICYDNAPISFRRFSHHTIYRRPSHTRRYAILRRCLWCGEAFSLGFGCGPYCSARCQEMSAHAKGLEGANRPSDEIKRALRIAEK